jgi:hypothetical protein
MIKRNAAAKVTTREEWAAQIIAVLDQTIRRTVEGFIEMGRMLIEAKRQLDYGDFTTMIESDLPFGERTAQRLMAIAEDQRLPTHVSVLPPSWGTLYELTRLPDEAFERAISEGRINPDMERADVQRLLPEPEPVVIDHEPEPTSASPKDDDDEPAQAEGAFPIYGNCAGGRVVTERTSTKAKVNAADAPGPAPQTNFDESKPTEFDDNIDPKELGRTLERALEAANAFSNWSKREPIPERRKKQIAKQVEAMREVVSEFHRLLRWEPRRQKKLNDSALAPVSTTPAMPPVGDEL